jgi:hypothetical protein
MRPGARIAALAELKHSQIQNRPLPDGDTDNRTRPKGIEAGLAAFSAPVWAARWLPIK